MANRKQKESPRIANDKMSCDICDNWVTMAHRQDGEGAGSIWVCNDCDTKFPKLKTIDN